MLSTLKQMKWSMIITSIVMTAFGILLAFYPEATADMICNLIGIAVIGLGCMNMIRYFMMKADISFYRNDFMFGLLAVLLGVIIIWKKSFFLSLIPTIFGIIILASGISKLQDGIDAKRLGYSQGMVSIVLSLIAIVLGIVIITQPFGSVRFLFITIGFALIYCGLSDLFNTIYLSTRISQFHKRMMKDAPIDADYQLIDNHEPREPHSPEDHPHEPHPDPRTMDE